MTDSEEHYWESLWKDGETRPGEEMETEAGIPLPRRNEVPLAGHPGQVSPRHGFCEAREQVTFHVPSWSPLLGMEGLIR